MKRVFLMVAIVLLATGCAAHDSFLASKEKTGRQAPSVIVSLNVTEALADVLLDGTDVAVKRVIPAEYPMRGHTAYLKKHGGELAATVGKADAAVIIRSAWPDDPLYPWARRMKIRIVAVDATRPLDESRAGIPLKAYPGTQFISPYVWTGPGGLSRMADIMGADCARLYPRHADRITDNLRSFKGELFRLRTQFESRMSMLDVYEVMAVTGRYAYLTEEFGLEVVRYMTKPEYRWKDVDVQALEQTLRKRGIRAVICAWEPRADIAAAIDRAGAVPVMLSPFPAISSENRSTALQTIADWYTDNLNRLLNGLENSAS